MAITIDGSNGISDLRSTTDGSASTPAVRGTDTNTGIFFPAADTIAFAEGGAEAMRIDSSGNVGIATTSPSARLDSTRSFTSSNLAAVVSNPNLALTNTANYGYPVGMLFKAPLASGGSVINNASIWAEWTGDNNAYLGFATTNGGTLAERMRIDSSGNLLVGVTSVSGTYTEKLAVAQSGNISAAYIKGTATTQDMIVSQVATDSGTRFHIAFRDGSSGVGSQRGSITSNGSSTAYNTTSDYRLKENVAPMTGALDTVSALKPVTYTWKENGSSSQGFIAHELAEVVPDAVTGEKDAVNEDGSIKPQSIDTSFLVATLTAAIKEQQAIIETLKTRIEALEQA
jgi:hypothetical protein